MSLGTERDDSVSDAEAVDLTSFYPQLPPAERDRRWAAVRTRMEDEGLGALILVGNDTFYEMGMVNLRYLTQVGSRIGALVLFTLSEDPIIWNGALTHMHRPTNVYKSTQSWVSDIRVGGVSELAAEVRARGLDHGRIGVLGFNSAIMTTPTILHGQMIALEEALPRAELHPAGHILEQVRMIKSEVEIDHLRQAGILARKTVDAMIAAARPGVTEADVYAEMIRTQIAEGGEPLAFNLMSSGPVEHGRSELWHLLHGAEQPASPNRRQLQLGDVIVTEFHASYAGYLAACEFSIFVGDRAPAKLLDIHKTCVEALYASEEVMVAGTPLKEVWRAIRRPAEANRMDFVELGFHGHGLASPEFPTAVYRPGAGPPSLDGSGIGDLELQEGMVFGNNLDIFDPAWKPDVGCMLGGMLVVRDGRSEPLVDVPLDMPQVT